MRKRGKYGLTNTIYTSKIGGFLPYIVLDGEALLLMPEDARDPGAAAGDGPLPRSDQHTEME